MTIEYVMLLAIGGLVFMSALLKAPKAGFEKGSVRLGARVETQLSTGNGFNPYQTTKKSGGDNGKVEWAKKE